MYAYIKGELTEQDTERIVVETGGIGYQITVPGAAMDYLPSVGEQVKIYTYLYVREDAMLLYGFLTRDDLKVFKLLISVSGIGPKGALAILSVMTTDELRYAVLGDDAKRIAKAPGVGNKTAQRLILELKDKLNIEDVLQKDTADVIPDRNNNEASAVKKEAVEALTALGYSSSEALGVLAKIEITKDSDVEDVLKAALKQMAFI